jgi:hypothetical protein
MKRWPNLFIVGAPKAGTTSLHEFLKTIPEVYMSRIKEPYYFTKENILNNDKSKAARYEKKYLNLFKKGINARYIGESSPSYLSDNEAPKQIIRKSPSARILICLRDPVERSYSHYLMLRRNRMLDLSFKEFVKTYILDESSEKDLKNMIILTRSLYYENCKRYLDIFGRDYVHIIFFEELVSDTATIIRNLLNFLGLRGVDIDLNINMYNPYSTHINFLSNLLLSTKGIRKLIKRFSERVFSPDARKYFKEKLLVKPAKKPLMGNDERIALTNYFYNDVNKLHVLLKRQLPWTNFNVNSES